MPALRPLALQLECACLRRPRGPLPLVRRRAGAPVPVVRRERAGGRRGIVAAPAGGRRRGVRTQRSRWGELLAPRPETLPCRSHHAGNERNAHVTSLELL